MKIERLFTLSQFVDWISKQDEYGEHYVNKQVVKECRLDYPAIKLITDKIIFYNYLLKQAANKNISDELLFKGNCLYWIIDKDHSKILGGHFKSWDEIEQHMTLSDLAEKTNGQLKLKNMNI